MSLRKTILQMATLASVMDLPTLHAHGNTYRGESGFDIPSKRGQVLYYKAGFAPMHPSRRHPAKVLHACGWRTKSQLEKMKRVRERIHGNS